MEPNELEEKLKCIFTAVGEEIGATLRCVIETMIESKMQEVVKLNNLLNGAVCNTDQE